MTKYLYHRTPHVARLCEVTVDVLRADLRAGRIKAFKPGSEYLFTDENVDAARAYYRRRRGRKVAV